jgi:hypothetical protein
MHTYGKLLGAPLLLVNIAFPMATCSHYEDAERKRVEVAGGGDSARGREGGDSDAGNPACAS